MGEETVADDLKGQMDPNNLYREEVITDRKVGTIRMLTPVTDRAKSILRASLFSWATRRS